MDSVSFANVIKNTLADNYIGNENTLFEVTHVSQVNVVFTCNSPQYLGMLATGIINELVLSFPEVPADEITGWVNLIFKYAGYDAAGRNTTVIFFALDYEKLLPGYTVARDDPD